MTFRFAYPIILVLFGVVAAWLYLSFRRDPPTVTYSVASQIAALAGSKPRWWSRAPLLLRAGCLGLLLLAASRPQLFNVSRELRSPGVDIMLCLDTSGSMRALDFQLDDRPVTRLTAVKKVVNDFIKKRKLDRIGLVVFGEEAFTQSPLTMDKGLLLTLVEKMEIGMAGDRTAIGAAIAIGAKRLKDLEAKSRILILLTDGRQNAGPLTPEAAAEAARALNIKIHTIGVGGKGPAPIQVRDLFGTRLRYMEVDLDEETLKKVANIGGGNYFRATDSERLSEIYAIIDREEKTEIKVKEFFHFRELYAYFLIPAIVLLGLEIFLKSTILRVIP
jgi:Ca-activated chloride channel family protein